MSFLTRLFGGSKAAQAATEPKTFENYKGFNIAPEPMPEGGQWRLSARINKQIGDELKSHHLIRADMFAGEDAAATAAVAKARQVIDEQGDGLFR